MENRIRKTNTVSDIKRVFVELINEKGFQELNVTDITRKAEIGRGTFYTHFTDKYDLLANIETEMLDHLKSDLGDVISNGMRWLVVDKNTNEPAPFIVETLKNFYKNRVVIAALLSENGDPYFLRKIKKLIFKDLNESLQASRDQIATATGIPEDYAREFVIDEVMGIIVYWISKDEPEDPIEVAKTITKLQSIAPFSLFTKQKEENDHE
ncbi:TetR/AcrR family transcriptional regulator [Fructilactobacillus vespulae]|uniref:TetR/AcrR family transcriptional regulator n=1 Tax=Fructilactobacillus vespulae TaxID=1249630 RepID=UPI0039B537AA